MPTDYEAAKEQAYYAQFDISQVAGVAMAEYTFRITTVNHIAF